MNAIIAQVKKDAVPLRGVLITIGILFALNFIALLGTLPELHPMMKGILSVQMHGDLFSALQFVILLFLLVMVIHQDPLTDPAAFWRSRPLSRGQLLLGKAALFLPLLVMFLVQAAGTDDVGEWKTYVFMAGLAAFAAVTTKLTQMITLFFKAYLGFMAVWIGLLTVGGVCAFFSREVFYTLPHQNILNVEHPPALQALLVFCFLAVVVYQYLTLRTTISVWLIFLTCWAAFI